MKKTITYLLNIYQDAWLLDFKCLLKVSIQVFMHLLYMGND